MCCNAHRDEHDQEIDPYRKVCKEAKFLHRGGTQQ
jgi:hypothetical protein